MKISLEWLNEYVNVSREEIHEKLPKLGFDIDNDGPVFSLSGPIVVGKIEKVEKHPHAERLVICYVNIGNEHRTILTADTSVECGKYVYVALEGSKLANGVEIQRREMKGITSEGMLCSLEEIGLAEKSEHVYMTDEHLPLGEDVIKLLKLNDWYFEIQVTPNRPDCLSYFGIARELAAGLKRVPRFPIAAVKSLGNDKIEVEIDTDGCYRYTARVIRDVKVEPSPLWLQKRLISSGIRPINNIVDITNYVMLETGHPVHAFDLNKVAGKIVVRDAQPGEKMLLLDGKTYEFSGGEVLITDGEKLLALGGIMGGEESGISQSTTDVLLEVAMFDPVRIRRTARKLGISSDSSYRFERGVDFDDAYFVIERLSELIQQLAGGAPSSEIVDAYKKKLEQKVIFVPKHLPKKVLGIEIRHIGEYIQPLGFEVEELKDGYNVYVPSFRYFDVSIPEDIMEEVGRIHGYDNLHSEPPRMLATERGRSEKQKTRYEIKQLMISMGFNEANTLSFTSSKVIEKLEIRGKGLNISNPIISDFDTMRPSIIYGLLESLSYNYKRQIKDVRLFEIGKVFNVVDNKPFEQEALALVATGRESVDDYTDKRTISFYTFKGVIDEIFLRFGIDVVYQKASINGLIPTRCAVIKFSNEEIGFLGMLEPELADKFYDVKDEIYIGEIYIEKIYDIAKFSKPYKNIPQFPYIRRDVSYLIPIGTEIAGILEIYKSNPLVEEVGVDDIYRQVGEGHYSVTIYAKFRHSERTLNDEEVDLALEEIKKKIKEKFDINPRF
ncbi:MAG: phenylalanine--tRNA ligase subunit beta [Fervidobacterium sp.]|nr:phenylalanine--tRNA ligase subunit beta [Fervidobacterium sp.]